MRKTVEGYRRREPTRQQAPTGSAYADFFFRAPLSRHTTSLRKAKHAYANLPMQDFLEQPPDNKGDKVAKGKGLTGVGPVFEGSLNKCEKLNMSGT